MNYHCNPSSPKKKNSRVRYWRQPCKNGSFHISRVKKKKTKHYLSTKSHKCRPFYVHIVFLYALYTNVILFNEIFIVIINDHRQPNGRTASQYNFSINILNYIFNYLGLFGSIVWSDTQETFTINNELRTSLDVSASGLKTKNTIQHFQLYFCRHPQTA